MELTSIESNILESLKVYKSPNNKIRLGNTIDGGYVIVDGFDYDFYVSCGIGTDVGFDIDFCKRYSNIRGLAFDGTCVCPNNLPLNLQFINKNIGKNNDEKTTNLIHETEKFENIFLKMDIEGHEWTWVNVFPIEKFKQIVIECHGFFDENCPTGSWGSLANFVQNDIFEALSKINKTHLLVHLHANNAAVTRKTDNSFGNSNGSEELFTVAELTFIRKDFVTEITLNSDSLPILGIDFPNYSHLPEIDLNRVPFVNKMPL